jgi:7-keto-8-aminopelargonate synthetase-like enzyme
VLYSDSAFPTGWLGATGQGLSTSCMYLSAKHDNCLLLSMLLMHLSRYRRN